MNQNFKVGVSPLKVNPFGFAGLNYITLVIPKPSNIINLDGGFC